MRSLMFRSQTSAVSAASPEQVFDVISDLRAHLVWSGERADDEKFKLVSIDAPAGPAAVGTTFTSSGTADNGTFSDRSTVTQASRPNLFVIETDAHLDRTRGKPWDAHFEHRYDIQPSGTGSEITYTETIQRVSYVPYWLKPWAQPLFRWYVNRSDVKQLRNLARLAEERSRDPETT